jgi:hypothetical protein
MSNTRQFEGKAIVVAGAGANTMLTLMAITSPTARSQNRQCAHRGPHGSPDTGKPPQSLRAFRAQCAKSNTLSSPPKRSSDTGYAAA